MAEGWSVFGVGMTSEFLMLFNGRSSLTLSASLLVPRGAEGEAFAAFCTAVLNSLGVNRPGTIGVTSVGSVFLFFLIGSVVETGGRGPA
jgi:hypothetical protein